MQENCCLAGPRGRGAVHQHLDPEERPRAGDLGGGGLAGVSEPGVGGGDSELDEGSQDGVSEFTRRGWAGVCL